MTDYIRYLHLLSLLSILFSATSVVVAQKGHGGPAPQVSDGHRLITRALWRIFDALMEKKNHEELYGRMNLVEKTLSDMMTSDTKLDKEIKNVKISLGQHKEELTTFMKELERLKNMEHRVKNIEETQLRLERQRDEGLAEVRSPKWASASDFHICPSPFVSVGTMCIHVVSDRKLAWREARRECANYGGDLASPRELAILRDYLASMPNDIRPEYVWVGGSRTVGEQWVWATGNGAGRPMDMSQETWNEELPEGIGDCLGLFGKAEYRAYDYTCTEEDNFVCQYFF